MAKRDRGIFRLLLVIALTTGVVLAVHGRFTGPGQAIEQEVKDAQSACLKISTCARTAASILGAAPSSPRSETRLEAAKRAVESAQQALPNDVDKTKSEAREN